MFKTERGCDREGMDERFFECGIARDRCATGRQCRSSLLRSIVTGRLLPRRFCFDAGDEFFVVDKAVEEVVPFLS